MPSATTRKPAAPTLPSSQNLHDALASADDAARLARFSRSTGCTPDEVAGPDGRLGILQVFDAMRRRGYTVAQPIRPQAQRRPGFTTWLVSITLPSGVSFDLAYHTEGIVK